MSSCPPLSCPSGRISQPATVGFGGMWGSCLLGSAPNEEVFEGFAGSGARRGIWIRSHPCAVDSEKSREQLPLQGCISDTLRLGSDGDGERREWI